MKLFDSKQEININIFLKLISLNKTFYIGFILVFVFLVAIYSFIVPHKYQSVSSILPPSKQDRAGGISGLLQGLGSGTQMPSGLSLGGLTSGGEVQVFVEILHSRTVADYIANDLKLYSLWEKDFKHTEDLLSDLRKNILRVWHERSGVVFIEASVKTDFFASNEEKQKINKLASQIANSAVNALDSIMRVRNVSSAKQSKLYIEDELQNYYTQIEQLEKQIEDFQIKNKVIDIDEQAKAIVSQAIEIGKQLSIAEIEYNIAKIELERSSPKLKQLEQTYKILQEQYNNIQRGGLTSNDVFSIPLEGVPSLLREYASLYRERKIMEQVIFYLETQKHQEAIQEKRDIPVVEVLDYAVPSAKHVSPKKLILIIFGFIFSAVLGAIIIVVYSSFKGNIYLKS